MRATFKETWTSIRDLEYGKEIVKKTVGQAFWYWFKYVLTISLVILGLSVATLTYLTPQIPQFAEKTLPDIQVHIKDGKLTTDAKQPLELGDDSFKIILNTAGAETDLDQIKNGALILADRILFKDDTQTKTVKFSELDQEVSADKPTIVNWLKDHRLGLLMLGLVIALVTGIVLLGGYLVWKTLVFLLGSLILLLVGKILHRNLTFVDSLKLTIYAAAPALMISVIFTLTASQIGPTLSLITWVFLATAWFLKLPIAKTK